MKPALMFAIVIVLACPPVAHAGLIYGTVHDESGAPLPGTSVRVACPDFNQASPASNSASTDNVGAYRIFTSQKGRCQLQIGNARTTVFSYDDPVRYDFNLVRGQLQRH